MSDFTPRANLRLPGGGSTGTILPDEQVDIDVLNDNFRKIDTLLGARNVPSASSYSGSMDGDLIYARDTKLLSIYDANSAGLVNPRVAGGTRFKGTQAQMAAFTGAEDGDIFFNTTDSSEYVRVSGDWVSRGPFACHLTSLQAIDGSWNLLNGFTTDISHPGVTVSGSTITLAQAGQVLVNGVFRHSGNANIIMSAAITQNTTATPDLVNSIALISATANTVSQSKLVTVSANTVLRVWIAALGVSADTMTGVSLQYI